MRQRLVNECPEFNTIDAFHFLDSRGMGEISKQDLMQGLTNIFLVQYSERDVDLFIARFNKDGRGTLKYSEFYNAIKPKS